MALGELTDQELVDELAKFGENIVLPLKKGKKEILIKKLNHFRAREKPPDSPKKKGSRSSKKTHDVVSSDDSDVDRMSGQSSYKSTSLRRRSAGLPARPSAPVEVDEDGFKKPTPRRSRRSEPVFPLFSTKSFTSTSSSTSPSSSKGIRDYVDFSRQSKPSTSRGNSFYDDPSVESSDSDFAEESVYEVTNKSCNTSLPFDEEEESSEEEEEEHKVSPRATTRSRSKGSSKLNTSSLLNSFRNELDKSFGRKSLPLSRNNHRRSGAGENGGGKSKKKKYSFFSDHISESLVVVALIFFVLLIVGYMFVKSDSVFSWYDGVLNKGGTRSEFLLCEDFDEEQMATERCYTREEVDKAMIIIHDLYDLLSTRAGEVECGNEVDKDMTASDFKQQLKDMKHKRKEVARLFNASVDLIVKNPHWKLRVFKDDGEKAINPDDVSTLESTVASKSLVCRFSQSFYRVVSILILVGVVCCLVYFGIHWLRYKSVKSEVEQRKVFKMVEDIIDILREHCDNKDNQSSYMAVQHVRDQLLPPSERHELVPIWDKAVRFIEANESRIRLESQIIQGEEFEVWKWIHSVPNGGKIWQGQAFGEHNDTATSSLRYSPTPCLKVKNMFDTTVESEQEWYEMVENAILEKTDSIADIVHMYVDDDSKEGCVYIKCSSRESAGKARQCLHGWWFDGRLITARYLRLEHYHKQFPESVKAVRPLRFHKQQQNLSSLRQPYYRSTLEMT